MTGQDHDMKSTSMLAHIEGIAHRGYCAGYINATYELAHMKGIGASAQAAGK